MSTVNHDLPFTLPQALTRLRSQTLGTGWLWLVAAAFPPLLIYLRTMAPTVYGLDSAELTTGAYTLGIVHPPGSPVYLLLGHLFTWLPVGDVGYRVNLLSVVAGGVMVGFLYLILHQLTHLRWLALIVTWFLAFSYYTWISALTAELYALQGAWVAGLFWLALRWREQQRPWQLLLFTFMVGLGLGNHLSLVLLIPGFTVLLFVALSPRPPLAASPPRPFTATLLLAAAATGLLGTLIYLYLPIRYLSPDNLNYARDYWGINLTTWKGFWWMVSGRIFGSLFLGVPSERLPGELLTYLHQLWSNFLGLGFILGVVGVVLDFRRRPWLHLALGLMFLMHSAFYLTYRVVDKQFMFVPAYLIWAIWLALGAQHLHQWLSQAKQATQPSPWVAVVPITVMFLTAAALLLNYPLVNVSNDWSARQRGEAILTNLPANVIFYGTWTDVPILEYLQQVEGQRPDVQTRNLIFIGRQVAPLEVSQRLKDGQTIYTSRRNWFPEATFVYTPLENCGCYQMNLAE